MEPGEVPTVALIDDHPVVLAGMRTWYADAAPPIAVIAAGPDPSVATEGPGADADVVVLDLCLGRAGSGTGNLRELVDLGRTVIVYSMSEDAGMALNCLNLGAFCYLTKAEGERHLVAATRAAAAGRPYTPPTMAGAFSSDRDTGRPLLAPRESEVLVEWFQCESKSMVAARLGLSVKTVNTYLDRVRIKYANVGRPAVTKAHLVARAIQDGLVSLDEL
ncbi:DNA-binding response regulator [Pseudonocardiaceae bacterium YIM PH 21723]|nr:DNA-binding response regulator [Pseudonocardiaceae bacterium YIM PH 21723]